MGGGAKIGGGGEILFGGAKKAGRGVRKLASPSWVREQYDSLLRLYQIGESFKDICP